MSTIIPAALRTKLLTALVLTIGSTSLIFYLQQWRVLDRVEWIFQDWMLAQQAAERRAPDDIAIILIDEASLQAMAPIVGRWPWPRSVYADVMEYVALGNPKAVIFDLLFVEQQSHDSNTDDARLADATKSTVPTVHATQFILDEIDTDNLSLTNRSLPPAYITRFRIPNIAGVTAVSEFARRGYKYNNYLAPIDALLEASAAIGVTTIHRDRDGVLRKTPILHNYQDNLYPALSLAPLRINDHAAISVSGKRIVVHGTSLPLTTDGKLIINMYQYFNQFSMSGLLASISQLRAGNVDQLLIDPAEFENKYVFIGASAIGLNDLETTALGSSVPGVTVHASVLGNVLTRDFLLPPLLHVTLLCAFLLGLFTSVTVLLPNRLAAQVLLPMLGLGCFFGWVIWSFYNQQIVSIASPLITFTLTWAVAHSYLLTTEGREKRKVRRMFSQFVSPAALSAIVDQYEDYSAAGSGSKEVVSILFSDIRGFTSLSETLPAEKVVEILNFYFTEMTNAIHNNHGTIDKFIGDAIMAIWGAPIRTVDHPEQAVRAALDMVTNLKHVNQWLAEHDYEPINIGIGIHTGEVILGSIGSEYKADYTVIGDNVNLASRLEGITKTYGCQIIISEATYASVKDKIPCRIVDRVRVKGKHQPICIYSPLLGDQSSFSDKNRQVITAAEQGFALYSQQQWEQAVATFEQLTQDTLAQLHIQRCRAYQQQPPGDDWDGCHTMTSK